MRDIQNVLKALRQDPPILPGTDPDRTAGSPGRKTGSAPRALALAAGFLLAMQAWPGVASAPADTGAAPARKAQALEAGLFCDIFTLFEAENRPPVPPDYRFDAEDIATFADRPAFLSAGLRLRRAPIEVLAKLELQQDMGAWLAGAGWSNLPKAPDTWSLMWGNSYPRVGYAEASGPGWHVSAGRRGIGHGPGAYGMTISRANPWYDHILVALEAPLRAAGTGAALPARIGYSFTTLGVQRWWGVEKKTLFMHRAYLRTPRLAIGLGELNLVVGDAIDLQDIGPFLVYHHLFNSESNVMLQVELQAKPLDFLRLYGEFVLDDFRLSTESPDSNPNAMGFMAGAEWTVARFPDPVSERDEDSDIPIVPGGSPRNGRAGFFREDHSLAVETRPLRGEIRDGVHIRAETYLASTYLYRRHTGKPAEAYRTRYFFQTSTDLESRIVDSYFAYPIGPDTWLHRLQVDWIRGSVEARLAGEFRLTGSQAGETTYEAPYAEAWLFPQPPVSRRFDLHFRLLWSPEARLVLTGGGNVSFGASGTRMAMHAGAGLRLGIGMRGK